MSQPAQSTLIVRAFLIGERHVPWEVDGTGIGVRLRVAVRGVSPLIVRTIDVPAWVSLALLHRVLLACFGWSGECLCRSGNVNLFWPHCAQEHNSSKWGQIK